MKSRLIVIKEYFYRANMDNMKSFAAELKKLDEKDKVELGRLAAKELGYTQAQVDFNLE